MSTCPACGAANRDTALFCRSCSRRLPSGRRCPSCNRVNPADAQFCNRCSYSFGGTKAAPGQTGLLSPQSLLAGRYRIVRRVGRGGMGAVYEAEDLRLPGKQWAIKEMSDAAITDAAERAEALDAFHREAHFLSSLDHANLPKVVDSFEADGKHYLVMEFVDGQTLEELVVDLGRPLPPDTVLRLGVTLCTVLDYLHRHQPPIIFRDLKPGNIMLDRDGAVKLIDFGIARVFTPGKSRDTTSLGTKGYAAPEQYGKGQTDARSDVYALGATLHFLLTGRDPADDPFNFPPARRLNPDVSPALEATVARAVAASAADRWPTAREMRRALTRAAAVPTLVEAAVSVGDAAPSRRPAAHSAASRPVAPRAAATRSMAPRLAGSRSADSRSLGSRPAPARQSAPRPVTPVTTRPAWRNSRWFYAIVVVALAALTVFVQEVGLLGALFPLAWFTFSMLAGVLTRQFGAIGFTWLSIPLYNSIVGQGSEPSWAMALALVVPIELFFLLTRHRLYTPLTLLLASGLGTLGLWVVVEPAAEALVLTGVAVALGSLIAYAIGRQLEIYLT
jgi:serine/threonine-protein kinase